MCVRRKKNISERCKGYKFTHDVTSYNINEIILDTTSDMPFQNTNKIEPTVNDHKPQHDSNTDLHPQINNANKITSYHKKYQMLPLMSEQMVTTIPQ